MKNALPSAENSASFNSSVNGEFIAHYQISTELNLARLSYFTGDSLIINNRRRNQFG